MAHHRSLGSFMNYDLGYIDLEEKALQPLQNAFGPKVSSTICNLCSRAVQDLVGAGDGNRTRVRSLGSFYTAIVRRPLIPLVC